MVNPLDVKVVSTDGETWTVALTGEFDLYSAGLAVDELFEQVVEHGCNVVLDVSSVTFIDSIGLARLVRLAQRLEERGRRVVLLRPASPPKRLLDLAGLHDLLPVADSYEEALRVAAARASR